ncbi:MAG: GNAT family N-acetyltransferase [Deltaproteobacteria bacterium]|nr:GNAT family N-acetyltransferase [Deltaproteobacteria bacterium]
MEQYPIPVVLLARLAVSLHHQGCGIGRGLLQDAIRRTLVMAEQAGIRALPAHPIDEDATRFYLRFGFVVSPLPPIKTGNFSKSSSTKRLAGRSLIY